MSIHDPENLRRRASEILADAAKVRDPESHGILVKLAASYTQMAQQIEDMAASRAGRWNVQPVQQSQSQDKR